MTPVHPNDVDGAAGGGTREAPDMERRAADRGAFAQMLKEVNGKLNQVVSQLGRVSAQVEALASGFPEGDPDGHRRYHEEMIRQAHERAEFWSRLRFELAKWGLIGFAGWAMWALWQALLRGPK